jgi:phosphoribosylformylglycinamidine synthase subunit PurS
VRATVFVRPKQGILDAQGEAVEHALKQLGHDVSNVRVGRLIELDLAAEGIADAQVEIEQMCHELLANPLIEDVEFEATVE